MDGKEKGKTKFISVKEASLYAGLDRQTIRKLADEASIVCYRTPSKQRRIDFESLQKLCSSDIYLQEKSKLQKQNYLYTRVSTKKQVDDLSRQVDFLRRPEYADYILIQDIGSGINFKRKGLTTILDSCLQGNIGEIVVAHKDRLCRFGYDLIEQMVHRAGGKITVLQDPENKTSEQELADDLLAIIHVFSCRQMEKRNYRREKSKDIKDKDCSIKETEKDN